VARILIVDEEPAIAKAIRRMLRDHHVEAAPGGIEALARCAESPFDLVIYDLGTSDLGGAEMHQRLHQISPAVAQRLVFTSAGAVEADDRAWAAAHGVPWLEKPFDFKALEALVTEAAGGAGPTAPAAAASSG